MPPVHYTPSSEWLLAQKEAIQTHMTAHQQSWLPAPPLPETDAPIRVFIRARPLLSAELDAGAYSVLQVQEPRTCHLTVGTARAIASRIATKSYDADAVFGPQASNDEVYETVEVEKAVVKALDAPGFDWTILMYGQTGTGKTFTAISIEERLTASLFDSLAELPSAPSIKLSVYELRGPNAYDLLSDPPLQTVKLFPTASGKSPTVSWHFIDSALVMKDLLQRAKESRTTRSTVKNDTSSRSHCVVTLQLLHSSGLSTLHIIDLAGTERSTYSQHNSAQTQKETISTNLSLAVLKECIRARLDPGVTHVPWRSSRLTMVLRSAFESAAPKGGGGRESRVVVLACVSPSMFDLEDTTSTLKWIMPFQLSAADQTDGSRAVGPAPLWRAEWEDWSHDESVNYIKHVLPKFAPLSARLLPGNTTISALLPLSIPELSALCSTPDKPEPKPPTERQIKDAKVWAGTYHQKLADLRSGRARPGGGGIAKVEVKKVGGVDAGLADEEDRRKKALRVLEGREVGWGETGWVTRLDPRGEVCERLERRENARVGV